ncbi:MAG: hypothetical protein WBM99_02190, partial [Psychromonas sp.]
MKGINKNTIKWFLIIAMPIVAVWTSVIINNALNEKQFITEKTISETHLTDSNTSALIKRDMDEIIENLKVVRDADEFNAFLNSATDKSYDKAAQLFTRIMSNKVDYEQIRYLDNDGNEIIRVENNHGIVVTPQDKLQNKADRYYFINSIGLNYNEVYTSPLDLNEENG